MINHEKFILAPIESVLKEAIVANYGIGSGIETYPVNEYVMNSVFLKMTGFQEQKLKFITWEIASNDLEYRRKLLNNDDKLGECSTFEAKNKVYRRLVESITSLDREFNIYEVLDKNNLQKETIDYVKKLFKDTNLSTWHQRKFDYFFKTNVDKIIPVNQFLQPTQNGKPGPLFQSVIQSRYDELYAQRNTLAHNLSSYKISSQSFLELAISTDKDKNYFIWFSILILIDKIVIDLYNMYVMKLLEEY